MYNHYDKWLGKEYKRIESIYSFILDYYKTSPKITIKKYIHTFTYPNNYKYIANSNSGLITRYALLEKQFGLSLKKYTQRLSSSGILFADLYILHIRDDIYMSLDGIFRIKSPNLIQKLWNKCLNPFSFTIDELSKDERDLAQCPNLSHETTLDFFSPYINDPVFRSYLSMDFQKITDITLGGNHRL